jgi:phage terminase large subunit-like protein
MSATYRPVAILVEDNGPALQLQEQFHKPWHPVILRTPMGNKLARLRRHLDLFKQRRVVLRAELPSIEDLIDEFVRFPYGDHDDFVDAATQFFDWKQSNDLPPVRHRSKVVAVNGDARQIRKQLYRNGGRSLGPFVFSRRH